MNEADFASIYISRDWYLLLLDYVNCRIEDPVEQQQKKYWKFNVSGLYVASTRQQPKIFSRIDHNGSFQFAVSTFHTKGILSYFENSVLICLLTTSLPESTTTTLRRN
jgi:hypothetical protein